MRSSELLTDVSRLVVEDEKYNYISARYPGDAELLSEKLVAMVKRNVQQ